MLLPHKHQGSDGTSIEVAPETRAATDMPKAMHATAHGCNKAVPYFAFRLLYRLETACQTYLPILLVVHDIRKISELALPVGDTLVLNPHLYFSELAAVSCGTPMIENQADTGLAMPLWIRVVAMSMMLLCQG